MKLLHTSDWHLGRLIYGRKCHAEFEAFLEWLIQQIELQQVDCLLIAGDIFDTSTPNNTVQNLYYSFLYKVTGTCCRHVIIIGGNHDSPSLLNAPAQLLRQLHVQVVGSASADLDDEVLVLTDSSGKEEMIVCAVPYLRDREIRKAEPGETIEQKAQNLVEGIRDHYKAVIDRANRKRQGLIQRVPLIVTGHLFAAGGKIAENNEVRDLYIGSLAHVHSSIFPKDIDYLALGHLHIAQQIDDCRHIRYSGSPLQLSFGKGNSQKSITLVNFSSDTLAIEEIPVPRFLRLESISGSYEEIVTKLEFLIEEHEKMFVEIICLDNTISGMVEDFEEKIAATPIELLRVINKQIAGQSLERVSQEETLEQLSETEVFKRCLDAHDIEEERRVELEYCFSEILQTLKEEQPQERER